MRNVLRRRKEEKGKKLRAEGKDYMTEAFKHHALEASKKKKEKKNESA